MTLKKVTPSKYFINKINYKTLKAYFSLNSNFRCITTKYHRALLNAPSNQTRCPSK